jgi:diguanylate cyclase (GGDEF)-like protein
MSFRTRLTLFFVLIVVVPMVALGVVVARLVTDSEEGKADARAGAHVASVMRSFDGQAELGAAAARVVGSDRAINAAIRAGDRPAAAGRARALAREHGLARVLVVPASGGAVGDPLVDVGDPTAVAAGSALIRSRAGDGRTLARVEASTITAPAFVRLVQVPGVELVIRRDGRLLATSLPAAQTGDLPVHGKASPAGVDYVVAGFRAADFDGRHDTVSILTDVSGTSAAVTRNRRLAFGVLGGFLVLAFLCAILVSRQLQGQIGRFLVAARRIGGGDFSTAVPTQGGDEFAQLGDEFNKMSRELEQRIGDLDRERGRLRDSIQRVGETFASNLDRRALLELGTETIVEAVEAECGRATTEPGAEAIRVGDVESFAAVLDAAEARARATGAPAEAAIEHPGAPADARAEHLAAPAGAQDEHRAAPADPQVDHPTTHAAAFPIPRAREGAGPHGVMTVARRGRPFDEEERALLGSLAAQTGISLENVELHDQVARQAVTDELTGLFNHRRFQEVLAAEVATAQRFEQPVGLLMIDIDNFKKVNDTYGHQQGDLVLREVARVLRDCSREIDEPARYGGEEMAVALPQTDLEGAFTISERVRTAVEALAVPRLDGLGLLHVTVSCGVAASAGCDKDALVAAADAALYTAKRSGKNRTVRAPAVAGAAVRVE